MSNVNPFERQDVAEAYESWYDTPLGQTVDHMEKALIGRLARPLAGETALDVGTGTGHFARFLADAGLRVTGVDTSEAMLAQARAHYPDVTFQRADAGDMPFAAESFDLVLSVTMLEFAEDPQQAVAEMVRVTKRGGRVVLGLLNASSPWTRAREVEAEQHDTPYSHAHYYTAEEMVALLGRHGRVRWSSAVFVGHTGRGLRIAGALEMLGQTFFKSHGALLVGRVDK